MGRGMTLEWCKLYATFSTDPKVIGLSDKAFRRYVDAMCYCTLHETDGLFPLRVDKASRELQDAGLIDSDGRVHGWGSRQRSRADLDHEREVSRQRQRRYRGRSNAVTNGGVTTTEVEVEVEVEVDRERATTKTLAPPARRRDPIWDALIECYGEPTASARGSWNAAAKVLRDFGAEPGEITAMVAALRGSPSAWAVVTPAALAKHFGQRETLASTAPQGAGARSKALADQARRQGL